MSEWVIRLIDDAGYVGVFLLMFLETVFPPIPSEVIMPLAGYLASDGRLPLAGVIVGAAIAEAQNPVESAKRMRAILEE